MIVLLLPPQFGFFFISFCCLIDVTRTFNTMLDNSDECGQSCHVPYLRRTVFTFSSLSMLSDVGWLIIYSLLILRAVPSLPTCMRVFTIYVYLILFKLFLQLLTWAYGFSFFFPSLVQLYLKYSKFTMCISFKCSAKWYSFSDSFPL